jgi:hypothetical protein
MGRPDLFGADIAGAIMEALGDGLLDATLTRVTPGTRNGSALTAGRVVGEVVTSYACKGFTDDYSNRDIDGTTIRNGDRKILLLGKSLPDAIDPQPGDLITIEGRAWRISGPVKRDPAGATFECQVRQ